MLALKVTEKSLYLIQFHSVSEEAPATYIHFIFNGQQAAKQTRNQIKNTRTHFCYYTQYE